MWQRSFPDHPRPWSWEPEFPGSGAFCVKDADGVAFVRALSREDARAMADAYPALEFAHRVAMYQIPQVQVRLEATELTETNELDWRERRAREDAVDDARDWE